MTQLRIIDDHHHHRRHSGERMAEFVDRCRAGGLAITPQRLAIIEALLASNDHPRAEGIFDSVRRRHPHISLATVHRTLETLCAIGEARKVTVLHDSARYDGNLDPHHHVICVKCRTIRDIAIDGLDRAMDGNLALDGFTALGWALEVQALCDRCKGPSADRGRLPDSSVETGRRIRKSGNSRISKSS
jgi:Fur family transcriptional regulator, peroxide stress response regulator